MNDAVIRVEKLGKLYYTGRVRPSYPTLRDDLTDRFRKLFGHSSRPVVTDEPEGTIWALKDVSFEVKRGEVFGVIGANGSGKSTLLKILSRITVPTEGWARVRGRVGSLLEVGTGFHPELTGRENIYMNGAILGMSKQEIDHKFDEIVDFSGVEKFIDTPVKHYSSGMYVRLAFAVSAHLEPEVLLVDEVLAVGDVAFQRRCLGKMEDVAQEGRTVLLVSHSMGSIKELCSRSILLESGRARKIGLASDVVNLYLRQVLDDEDDATAEYIWHDADAPGDESAKLRSIRLCSASGETCSEFGTDEPIYVEVEYSILQRLPLFQIGFSIYSSDGTYIFYTCDDDMPDYAGQPHEPGEYVSRCQIPANWLNVGTYYIAIGGAMFGIRAYIFGRLPRLSLRVISTGGPTSRFNERRLGVLCPVLRWEICED